jgi:hypothetical protein
VGVSVAESNEKITCTICCNITKLCIFPRGIFVILTIITTDCLPQQNQPTGVNHRNPPLSSDLQLCDVPRLHNAVKHLSTFIIDNHVKRELERITLPTTFMYLHFNYLRLRNYVVLMSTVYVVYFTLLLCLFLSGCHYNCVAVFG